MSYVLIIAGSRDIVVSRERISAALVASGWGHPSTVVCGMARGPDLAGREWATWHGIDVVEMPAQWDRHGNAAGPLRNAEMARIADRLLAFWDGKSGGTRDMIDKMRYRKWMVVIP